MRLSFSHLYTYATCPKRYQYRFIEGLPEPMQRSASLGTSMHNALYRFTQAMWGSRLWKSLDDFLQPSLFADPIPELPPLPKLLELLDESWVQAGYDDTAQMYSAKERAIALLRHWYVHHAAELRDTIAVELPFSMDIDDVQITGRFDRIDKRTDGFFVVDYKSGMLREQAAVDTDMQLSIYALVLQEQLGLDSIRLALYFLADDVQRETIRHREHATTTRALIANTAVHIQQGDFAATPSERTCSYCPYRRLCPERHPNVIS